jgi:hypothetical protein
MFERMMRLNTGVLPQGKILPEKVPEDLTLLFLSLSPCGRG